MIIGLSGYAGSGKDTAALALMEEGFHRFAFGDELKKALLIIDPHIPSADAAPLRLSSLLFKKCGGDWNLAKQNPEVRRLHNTVGTDFGRKFIGENIWVERVAQQAYGVDRAVVTDVRFPNEANWVREAGGVLWRIERPGNRPATDAAGVPYESDVALDAWEFDLVIRNSGSIEDLHRAIRLALEAEAAP